MSMVKEEEYEVLRLEVPVVVVARFPKGHYNTTPQTLLVETLRTALRALEGDEIFDSGQVAEILSVDLEDGKVRGASEKEHSLALQRSVTKRIKRQYERYPYVCLATEKEFFEAPKEVLTEKLLKAVGGRDRFFEKPGDIGIVSPETGLLLGAMKLPSTQAVNQHLHDIFEKPS